MTPEQLAKNGTEDGHQAALFCKVAQNLRKYPELKWLHAIPNGGKRNAVTASRMKATGTRAGVLDIFLPVPMQMEEGGDIYNGLYIEMKKPGLQNHRNGGLSAEQVRFKKHVEFFGYVVVVCYTWEEAWNVLEHYISYLPADKRAEYAEAQEEWK